MDGPSMMFVRRRPTLPHPPGCSTIGAGGLSFRVRNVAGRFPSAMAAVTLSTCQTILSTSNPAHAVVGGLVWCCLWVVNRIVDAKHAALCGRVVVWLSPRPISTGQLNPLPGLHFRPINPVV